MAACSAEFGILGPLEVRFGDRRVDVGAPKQRVLLIALLIEANQTVSTDRLLECLWAEDPPGDAVKALRFHVSRLRATLREVSPEVAECLVTQPSGYRLDVDESRIDAFRFGETVHGARRLVELAPAEAAALLAGALAEWRGPALADVAFEEFAQGEIRRLDELRLAALVDRIGSDLRCGAGAELVGEVESLLEDHPTNEQLWAHLMLALHHAGRTQEALDAFRRARDRLADAGLSPSSPIVELESKILADDPSLRPTVAATSNLPSPVTELIGREGELARVAAALEHRRLVTLTGPGGVGKTSVALRAAHELAGAGRSVVWVELGSIRESQMAAPQLAAALGISVRGDVDVVAALRVHLRMRPVVVVLDDCDLVVGVIADLATQLVVACPEIAILCTSREALRAVGEKVIPIAPLAVSDGHVTPADAGPAVELFIARARDVDPDFAPTRQDLAAVSRICREVDGLPLAIELAATRIEMMTPTDLAAQLDHRINLLNSQRHGSAPRHDSLAATLRWSYDRLTAGEQLLLDRLSVFAGPFRVSDAEAVCGFGEIEPAAVLDLLAELVVKSFVARRAGTATASFQLLDTVREFAAGALGLRTDTAALADRHAEHYAAVAAAIRPVRGDLDLLATAEPDIMQAIDHYTAGQQLSAAAEIWLSCTAELLEIGRADRIIHSSLELLPHADELPPPLRGTILWAASNFANSFEEGASVLNGVIEAFGEAGMSTVGPRLALGMVFLRHGMLDDAVETLERSLAEFHDEPTPPGRVTEWDIRRYLATAHIRRDELDDARYHLERCAVTDQTGWTYHGEADLGFAELMRLDGDLSDARDLLLGRIDTLAEHPHHDRRFDCCLHSDLARIELALGHADDARTHITRAFEIARMNMDVDVDNEDCEMIAVAAAVAEEDQDWRTTAFIIGGLDAQMSRWGWVARPETMQYIDPVAAQQRSALDPARFADELAAGARASLLIELVERFLLATDHRQ